MILCYKHFQPATQRVFFMLKIMKINNLITLTKQVIAIPSYVDDNNNESEVLKFIEQFFQTNFPELVIKKQYLGKNRERYNLLMKGKNDHKLFVLGHVDTVQPKLGWLTNPLKPTIKNDKLYGLGAADMKGSLAAFMSALLEIDKSTLNNLMLLFYIDEEYDFKGIKRFLADRQIKTLSPNLILSLDGNLKLASGCRGLIEISMQIKGKSGHASDPEMGVNAITKTLEIFNILEEKLSLYEDTFLGKSTLNIAYIQGGVTQTIDEKIVWQREGNIIADMVDITFEIRPALKSVNAKNVLTELKVLTKKVGLKITKTEIRHNIAPWPVNYNKQAMELFKRCYKAAGVTFQKPNDKRKGYVDVQMIAEQISSPTFVIGTGGENRHGANEYVPIENLKSARKIYKQILKNLL